MARAAVNEVAGFCPMGCGQTLFLTGDGYISCSNRDCERALAVSEILGDGEHEHIVVLSPGTFTVRHPLRERLNDSLMACPLAADIRALKGPPLRPGRYRVWRRPKAGRRDWAWEQLEIHPQRPPQQEASDAQATADADGEQSGY